MDLLGVHAAILPARGSRDLTGKSIARIATTRTRSLVRGRNMKNM